VAIGPFRHHHFPAGAASCGGGLKSSEETERAASVGIGVNNDNSYMQSMARRHGSIDVQISRSFTFGALFGASLLCAMR
jgi:hypothetical protein